MGTRVMVMVGTKKGGFLLESDEQRTTWQMRGPFCNGWEVSHMTFDPATGAIVAACYQEVWPKTIPGVWRSFDLGETWSVGTSGLTYGEEEPGISRIWNLTPAHGVLYAGVEPAGLFRSTDGGESWEHIAALREHPTRPNWFPGNGGLCLHSIVTHPSDPNQIWVGTSAAGIFYSADGGKSWEPRIQGTRDPYDPAGPDRTWGGCVHKLVRAADEPLLLYHQFHTGVYRSDNGGQLWQEITNNLPSDFGFPMVVHPRDRDTIYTVPLHDMGRVMMEGRGQIHRSRDGGANWTALTNGLPPEHAYFNVLREGLAIDSLDPAGVYFGTNTGQVFASANEGDGWSMIADFLPRILSVEVALIRD